MSERPEDSLPRPATPGPWHVENMTTVAQADQGHIAQTHGWKVGDAEAIAALPEWVAAHDAEKARAERAEAALADVRESAIANFDEEYLDLLARHGYGEVGDA